MSDTPPMKRNRWGKLVPAKLDDRGYPVKGMGYRPNPPRPMTEERKQRFLDELAKHGIIGQAAKLASLHSHRGCMASFYAERENDPAFAEAWDEALTMARGAIEAELHRRGVEGYEEPVWWQGKEVGSVTKYSDALLLARIRAIAPEYRQKQQVEHSGGVEMKPLQLEQLTPKQRELLAQILEEDEKAIATPAIARIVVESVPAPDHESSAPLVDSGGGDSLSDSGEDDASPRDPA